MHISIPIEGTVELFEKTEVSPLIDKCVIKVCYVGEQPNRNHTVITKNVASEMGKKLPGSPIVGFYNESDKDFEGHNRDIKIGNGQFKIVDTTRPYGFVPTNAKVWFQKFNDDGIEHEYLCVEGYLWTKAYEEAKRILTEGNNQSMEIDPETEKGSWTNDLKSGDRIFIYNEALVEKLCILGQNVEPCFEGAQIKNQFSLAAGDFAGFEARVYALLGEMKDAIQGGLKNPMENEDKIVAPGAEETPAQEFAKQDDEKKENTNPSEGEKGKENTDKTDNKSENPSENKEENDDEKKNKKYNLDEVTEYAELQTKYAELEAKYTELQGTYSALQTENATLVEFKNKVDLKAKQDMVDSFYMLSDEDKKDVVDHINEYSLDDIESKLAIICVHKKVSFIKEGEEQEQSTPATTFSLEAAAQQASDDAPAWIKAVRENQK